MVDRTNQIAALRWSEFVVRPIVDCAHTYLLSDDLINYIVTVKRAKSIDQLYEEVSRYDLVIVPNSPLADALNRHLERPHFGPFAITPRRLATRRRETAEDRTAFLALIEETDLSWKQISHIVGDVLQCWESQGTADAILEYEGFDTPAARTVVDSIADLQTSSHLLMEYQIDPNTYESVAVIGEQQLTNLEQSILPADYTAVDQFSSEPFELPSFHIFESPTAIVDAVLNTVTPENAAEIGIVLDASSEYSPLIESALETGGIPYYGGPGFMDSREHRAFIQLLRCAIAGTDTRLHTVKPLLSCLGVDVSVEHDNKRLSDISEPNIKWLSKLSGNTEFHTIGDALTTYETQTGTDLATFRTELETLGLLSEPLTEGIINQLTFYLDTYEIPIERENSGVLLADAKSSSFVGRPVVFYLGLDESWTHESPNRPWVDQDEEFDRNIDGFQSLLQSGSNQYYLVQDTASGTPVTPCLYFEELLVTSYDRFSDLRSVRHEHTVKTSERGFKRQPLTKEITPEQIQTVSQSSLNTFANSPRDYLFGRLVESRDTHYFAEGNLFHDFAEFVVNHPAFVTDERVAEIVEIMVTETRSFHRDVDLTLQRTRYEIGLNTIREYLEEHAPTDTEFLTPASGWGINFFAEYFDREVNSPVTERWFEDEDLQLKGLIDLVQSPTQLVDFKTGNKKSATQVTKHGSIDEPSNKPNFQALAYLTYWRQQQPDEQLSFTFFHFLETLEDVLTGEQSVEDCLTEITYQPVSYSEFVQSEEVFEELREDAANDCNKTFKKSDYETYRTVVSNYEIPQTRDADEMAASPFGKALVSELVADVGDYKYVRKGCKQALRHLCGYRKGSYFEEDLDVFERFVDEQISQLNQYRRGEGRFPIDGRAGEPNYRYVNNREMLLTEQRPEINDSTTEATRESTSAATEVNQ